MSGNKIKLFESAQIRAEWDADAEKWWFSIVDVVAILRVCFKTPHKKSSAS